MEVSEKCLSEDDELFNALDCESDVSENHSTAILHHFMARKNYQMQPSNLNTHPFDTTIEVQHEQSPIALEAPERINVEQEQPIFVKKYMVNQAINERVAFILYEGDRGCWAEHVKDFAQYYKISQGLQI